jgi:hypothetical protein
MIERSLTEEIKALFVTKSINAAGIYLVVFYVNGVRTPVIVDDNIPTRGLGPIFA